MKSARTGTDSYPLWSHSGGGGMRKPQWLSGHIFSRDASSEINTCNIPGHASVSKWVLMDEMCEENQVLLSL